MPETGISDLGDLTPMTDEIIEVIKKYTKSDGVGLALVFTVSPDFDVVHYSSNLERKEACHLLEYSAKLFNK